MSISYRLVQKNDFENLLRWRNRKDVRDLFFNRDIISINDHLDWLKGVEKDPARMVWIIESDKSAIGVVQIYNYDCNKNFCWWGAYPVDKNDSDRQNKAEVWFEIEKAAQMIAKSELNCITLYCESLKRNKFVVSMHERFGFETVKSETRSFKDRREKVVIMKKNINHSKKMIILGSSNWDAALSRLEQVWNKFTDKQLEITKIPYGQYKFLLKKEGSELLLNHDIVLVAERIEDFLPRPFSFLINKNRAIVEERIVEWLSIIDLIRQKTNVILYILSFAPVTPVLSSISYKDHDSVQKWVDRLNGFLLEKVEKLENAHLLPLGRLVNKIGVSNSDPGKYYQLARLPYSDQLIRAIGEDLVARELIAQGMTSRVLVLDLDNTLWGGEIGESGIENIQLSNDYPGNIFVKIQEAIKVLQERGVVLALCSKNDESNAFKVLHNHESMLLTDKDIVAWRINWSSKADNIREISKELSLSLKSFAFLDDSPYERELISIELPDVNIITWPDDISELPNILLEHPKLQSIGITNSDRIRTQQYYARQKIKNLEKSSDTYEQYLLALKMKIAIIDKSKNPSERIIQLIAKTNQFNATTRRHNIDDILTMIDHGAIVYSISLEDKFSKKETIGALILMDNGKQVIIESFVLSCRVLGRGVEYAIIEFCINTALKNKHSELFGEFVASGKNSVVKQAYLDMNFNEVDGGYLWKKDINKARHISYINFNKL